MQSCSAGLLHPLFRSLSHPLARTAEVCHIVSTPSCYADHGFTRHLRHTIFLNLWADPSLVIRLGSWRESCPGPKHPCPFVLTRCTILKIDWIRMFELTKSACMKVVVWVRPVSGIMGSFDGPNNLHETPYLGTSAAFHRSILWVDFPHPLLSHEGT